MVEVGTDSEKSFNLCSFNHQTRGERGQWHGFHALVSSQSSNRNYVNTKESCRKSPVGVFIEWQRQSSSVN